MRARLAVPSVLFLLAFVAPPGAHTQQFPPFGTRLGPGLNGGDLSIIGKATRALNQAGTTGSRQWSNPKTGVSGTATLVRGFQSGGLPCHEMKYLIR